jgi:hypothetical protein
VNVTPNTPPQLPILYTWNNGQVYELAGLQGFGCVDTVYSTTATTVNGTTTYNTYSVLPANQGLQIVEAYEAQFGVANLACNDYVQQAMLYNQAGATATSSSTAFGIDFSTPGGWIELGVYIFIGLVIIWGIVAVLDRIFGKRR